MLLCTAFRTSPWCINAPFSRRFMVRFAPYILREFEQPRGFQRFRWVHKSTTPHGAIRPIPNGANWLLVVYSPLNPPPQEPKNPRIRSRLNYQGSRKAGRARRAPRIRSRRRQSCRCKFSGLASSEQGGNRRVGWRYSHIALPHLFFSEPKLGAGNAWFFCLDSGALSIPGSVCKLIKQRNTRVLRPCGNWMSSTTLV